ncbi:MAG: serine/threonine-protein kinase, partial [Chloroflexota bacterium]
MISIPGYQITKKLSESNNSVVYRGVRDNDRKAVVLKVLNEDHPSPLRIARFQQAYETIRLLKFDGIVQAYGLETIQAQWVIVLEDFGGVALNQARIIRHLNLETFLPLAIKITNIIAQIHQQQIIHKDITPANILINPQTQQVKLIDFDIATVLSREQPAFRNPSLLEGTLAYIAPEQTGRMNRAIDYRTDFYSLGATFYEMLTGQPPFQATDPLTLIHHHLAIPPQPPHLLNPEIPSVLSQIIVKLLAKNAEDRYQSTDGLVADLQACLQQWQKQGRVEWFLIGQKDISDTFQLPQKLYGRKQALENLLTTFAHITHKGVASETEKKGRFKQTELILVTGQA